MDVWYYVWILWPSHDIICHVDKISLCFVVNNLPMIQHQFLFNEFSSNWKCHTYWILNISVHLVLFLFFFSVVLKFMSVISPGLKCFNTAYYYHKVKNISIENNVHKMQFKKKILLVSRYILVPRMPLHICIFHISAV